MPRRRIGQETLFQDPRKHSSLDEIAMLIDWAAVAAQLQAHPARPSRVAARLAVKDLRADISHRHDKPHVR